MSKDKRIFVRKMLLAQGMVHPVTQDALGTKQIEVREKNDKHRFSVAEDVFHNSIVNVTIFDLELSELKKFADDIYEYIDLVKERGV